VRGGEAPGEIGYRGKICQIERFETDFRIRELVAYFRDRFAAFGFVATGQHYLRSSLREPHRGLIAESAGPVTTASLPAWGGMLAMVQSVMVFARQIGSIAAHILRHR
jgi:hypothetical protein